MKEVELHAAYVWDCDDCGRENFTRGCTPNLSDEEVQEIREELNLDDGHFGNFVLMPDTVECKFCKTKFIATYPSY